MLPQATLTANQAVTMAKAAETMAFRARWLGQKWCGWIECFSLPVPGEFTSERKFTVNLLFKTVCMLTNGCSKIRTWEPALRRKMRWNAVASRALEIDHTDCFCTTIWVL